MPKGVLPVRSSASIGPRLPDKEVSSQRNFSPLSASFKVWRLVCLLASNR
jgi:hypothetical protein